MRPGAVHTTSISCQSEAIDGEWVGSSTERGGGGGGGVDLHLGISGESKGAPFKQLEEVARGDPEECVQVPLLPRPVHDNVEDTEGEWGWIKDRGMGRWERVGGGGGGGCVTGGMHLHLGVSSEPQGASFKQLEEIARGDREKRVLVPFIPHPFEPVLVSSITDAVALSSKLTHLLTKETKAEATH